MVKIVFQFERSSNCAGELRILNAAELAGTPNREAGVGGVNPIHCVGLPTVF